MAGAGWLAELFGDLIPGHNLRVYVQDSKEVR